MLRRRVRNELRSARLGKDLTQEQVAAAMDWSLSKMNRIEKAKTGISTNDLKALLLFYGITDRAEIAKLLDLAREARRPPWWQPYKDIAPTMLLELIDYESAASLISQFEPMVVPGILQTEDYARAVLQVFQGVGSSAERVPALVKLRTRRRDLLTEEGAPNFSFLLDESVIRRTAASAEVMAQQLAHLVDLAELPNVVIRVVPFAAGLHPGVKGAFKVIEFEGEPDESVASIEGAGGDLLIEEPEGTRGYLDTFHRIEQMALKPSETIDLLRKAAAGQA